VQALAACREAPGDGRGRPAGLASEHRVPGIPIRTRPEVRPDHERIIRIRVLLTGDLTRWTLATCVVVAIVLLAPIGLASIGFEAILGVVAGPHFPTARPLVGRPPPTRPEPPRASPTGGDRDDPIRDRRSARAGSELGRPRTDQPVRPDPAMGPTRPGSSGAMPIARPLLWSGCSARMAGNSAHWMMRSR
jgi:hypothetical protein